MIENISDIAVGTLITHELWNGKFSCVYIVLSHNTELGCISYAVLYSNNTTTVGKVFNTASSVLLNKKSIAIV